MLRKAMSACPSLADPRQFGSQAASVPLSRLALADLTGTPLWKTSPLVSLVATCSSMSAAARQPRFAILNDGEWHRAFDLTMFPAVRLDRALLPTMLAPRRRPALAYYKNSIALGCCFVGLAEAVAGIGHRESAILLRRHLEIISGSIVLRRRRGWLALWRRSERRDGHCGLRFIQQIRDEHSGHGVLLAAEQREVHLPDIGETGGTEKHLHRFGWSPFPSAIVHDRGTRMKRVQEQIRIDVSMAGQKIQINGAEAVVRTHQIELPI